MDKNQVSTSARISAFGRAYHATHDEPKIFDDFLADQLFTEDERVMFSDNLARALQFFDPEHAAQCKSPEEALAGFMRAQSVPITLSRARYVEEVLEEETARGVTQYVILGAGLDTFAFRRPELMKQLDVFEVDQPGTQNFKRERIAQVGWEQPASLHYVAVDFTEDDLASALQRAGYDANKKTLFSWLGVTYYLSREVIDQTIRTLAGLAPRGSMLVFDYLEANAFVPERTAKRVRLMQEATIRAGEPMKTGFDPAMLAAELGALGFELVENLGPDEIQARYFAGRTDGYFAYPQIWFARAERRR